MAKKSKKKKAKSKKAKPVKKASRKPKPKKAVKRKVSKKAKPKKKSRKSSASVQFEPVRKTRIRVIGIGGGGGSIVSEIASKMKKASFVAANTDRQALKTLGRNVIKFQFGEGLTHGMGTGMDPDLGKEAALAEKEKIKKLLKDQDLCVIVSCFGGGTGSGAASVFAKISKDMGNLTYGIFTLPFKFEGEKKVEIANDSLKKTKTHLNALSVIPNERVFQIIDKSTPLKQALSTINKNLSDSLEGLIETIYEPGMINIDFADFKTVLEGKGRLAYLNTLEVSRRGSSAKDLINKVLASPLYPYDIKGAKGVLFNIAGEKDLSLTDVNQISNTISELVNSEAKIIFGIAQSKKYSATIKTTLLATGCGMKPLSGFKLKKPVFKKPEPEKVEEPAPEPVKKKRKKRKKPVARKEPVKIEKNVVEPKKKPSVKKKKPVVEKKPEKKDDIPNISLFGQRKNGLQLKKEAEDVEREMIEREKFWETPAFLRKSKKEE